MPVKRARKASRRFPATSAHAARVLSHFDSTFDWSRGALTGPCTEIPFIPERTSPGGVGIAIDIGIDSCRGISLPFDPDIDSDPD
jgi:hypothetical protein